MQIGIDSDDDLFGNLLGPAWADPVDQSQNARPAPLTMWHSPKI
jgi:hypothetical protein